MGCAYTTSVKVLVSQSCLALCDLVDCTPPGSSVHTILQARILEWVAISYSRGSSWPRNWTQVSCFVGSLFTIWSTREAQNMKWLGKTKIFLTLIAFILGSEDSLNCFSRTWTSVFIFQVSTFPLIFLQVLFLKHHHPVQYVINFGLKNNSLDNSVIFQIPVSKFHLIFLFFVPWIESIFSYDIIVLYFSTKVSFYFFYF